MMIGIEEHTKRFYEGQSSYGREMWPPPVASVATVLKTQADYEQVPDGQDLQRVQLVFREDHFDAVTRIKRGRFYGHHGGGQPHEWTVPVTDVFTRPRPQLCTFVRWPAFIHLSPVGRVQVALGNKEASSIWNVVGIERIVTGEDLVTLRARSALGALPQIDQAEVPAEGLVALTAALDKAVDAAFRAGPVEVVDRCRDAVTVALGVDRATRLKDPKIRQADLGELIKKMESDLQGKPPTVRLDAARIIGRFHSRAKPNEQERYESRPVEESDAEAALSMLGLVLRELGWTSS